MGIFFLGCKMLYMPTGWRHYAVPAPEPEPDAAPGNDGSTSSAGTKETEIAIARKAYDAAIRAAKASGRPLPKPPPVSLSELTQHIF